MSKQMHIVANFDIDQVSPMLECTYKCVDPQGQPDEGKYAGAVRFRQGQEVFVQFNAGGVMPSGSPEPFASFDIIDCTITTRPRVYRCGPNEKKTVYAPPSLFERLYKDIPQGATVVLPAGDFDDAPVADTPPDYFQKGKAWKGKLVVGQTKARWRMTIMVTVKINYAGDVQPEYAVYEIDPESEVSTGTGPKEEEGMPEMLMKSCEIDPESEVSTGTGP